EVIEREVVKEVVPDEVKQQLEQFKQKFERESNNANELRDELQKYRNSFSDPNQAYEEKELTRLERESSINAHKIAISIQNFIKENSVETYRLDTGIKANPKSKERLEENVALLKEFTNNLEAMLNGRIIVNYEEFKMAKRKDELVFLQNHIKQTNEQGQQLEQVISRMLDMEDRVENRVSYVEDMVEEIKKEVPITYEQQKELQSIVQTKSNQFTRQYYKNGFPVDDKY